MWRWKRKEPGTALAGVPGGVRLGGGGGAAGLRGGEDAERVAAVLLDLAAGRAVPGDGLRRVGRDRAGLPARDRDAVGEPDELDGDLHRLRVAHDVGDLGLALGAVEDAVALDLDVDPEAVGGRRGRHRRRVDGQRHGGRGRLGAVAGDELDRAGDRGPRHARVDVGLLRAQRGDGDVVGAARGALEDHGLDALERLALDPHARAGVAGGDAHAAGAALAGADLGGGEATAPPVGGVAAGAGVAAKTAIAEPSRYAHVRRGRLARPSTTAECGTAPS